MALEFIIGGCGCGKTYECIKKITALANTADNIIYIVPQQFTLETERLLLEANGCGAIMQTRVLSFRRLAYVLMNGSDAHKPVLSVLGRAFTVRRIAYENREKLGYFSKVVDKQGFIDSLIDLMTEFFQYNITPEMLLEAYEKTDPDDSLSLKLKDLYIIYSAYRQRIQSSYTASEEALGLLAERIKGSEYIKNAHIFIDMMDYFIPQEYDVIKQLMLHAKSVTVALNGSFKSLDIGSFGIYDPFYESKRTVNRLKECAKECGVKLGKHIFLGESKRHAAHKDLLHLQKNYFRLRPEAFAGSPENISLVSAPDAETETEYVCRQICGLVRERGMRYDNIAVIIDASYQTVLKNKFRDYGIPVFIDSSRPVSQHPLTGFILCVLDILCYGINNKNMLRYMKNIFSPVSSEDGALLENYVLKHGLDGYAWKKKEWKYGFSSPDNEGYIRINGAKNLCMESLEGIMSALERGKKYPLEFIIDRLYDMLFAVGADKKLAEMAERAQQEGDLNAFRRHSRIWDELVRIFTEMVNTGGGDADTAEFSAVLRSGMELCSISIIPPTQDNIIIGDIDRSRLPQIKALFILGANEGRIPPRADDIGLFADRERTLLTERFFEMSANNIHKINLTDMNIYSLLLKPDERLYISYTAFAPDGRRAVRSSVVTRLLKLFPDAEVREADISDMPPAPLPAFERMLGDIRTCYDGGAPSAGLYESWQWFRENADFEHGFEMIESIAQNELAKPENTNMRLSRVAAEMLYGKDIGGSVSRLEKFAGCPFAYFLEYGLHIRDRDVYRFDALHLGNVFHSVLEDFSNTVTRDGRDWRSLDKKEISAEVERCTDRLIPNAFNEVIAADPHFSYTMKRIKKVMSHSINALCKHIRAGLFEPSGFEVDFGTGRSALPPMVFDLENGRKLVLNGKIDRVDIYEGDGNSFVKIIDYKSGTREFSREQLYYGLQLQLILYMDSYIRTTKAASGRELLPGGVFYFKVSDPMIEVNGGEPDIEKLLTAEYDMNGLVLNDSRVLNAIGEVTPPATARSKTKVETLKSAQTVSLADFNKLCEDAVRAVKILGREMTEGNMDIRPVKTKEKTGCEYCEYGGICRFEARENACYRTERLIDEDKDE